MNIAVLMLVVGEFEGAELSVASAQAYCTRHGYDLIVNRELIREEVSPNWNKILWLKAVLPQYDAVLLLDADTMCAGQDIPLEPFLSDGITASRISEGADKFCYGVVLFRNTAAVIELIDNVLTEPDAFLYLAGRQESEPFNRLLAKEGAPPVNRLPRHIFNAMYFRPFGYLKTNVTPETVFVHWAGGLKKDGAGGLMKEFS